MEIAHTNLQNYPKIRDLCIEVLRSGNWLSTMQEMERHVKAPLSNAKSTRDARLALEENGKFAIKTGQSRIAILLFGSLPCLSQMIKKTAALPDSESVLLWTLHRYDGT